MAIRRLSLSPAGSKSRPYRGADRRGIIGILTHPRASRLAAWAVAAILALPFIGVATLWAASGLPVGATSVGAADLALIAFLITAVVLLLRWRLVGEAADLPLATVALTAGLIFVPATHLGGPVPSYAAALQVTSVMVMLVGCMSALALPEVWAGLRPTLVVSGSVVGALTIAIPLAFAPVESGVQLGGDGLVVQSGLEGLVCAVVGLALLARGIRSQHVLFVGAGAALLSIAAGAASLSSNALAPLRPWTALPSFFLLAGAGSYLVLAAADLKLAYAAIVRLDLRGRRRWMAAESDLAKVSHINRGRSHDVGGILSAVDGTLLSLSTSGTTVPPEQSARLLAAVRAQIQQVMAMLSEDRDPARAYDLSALLAEIVALHSSTSQNVLLDAEAALEVPGRPDRVMRIVSNLLLNSFRYAPGANVTVTARRVSHPPQIEMAEVIVADDGPGLTDSELAHALEPGWRGANASGVPGSGLGLSQCRDLAEAEAGEMVLGPTHPSGPASNRGLAAAVRIPTHRSGSPAPSSSILQMHPGCTGHQDR